VERFSIFVKILFMSYIQIEQVSKSFSERQLFSDVTFSIEKGQKAALIAKNGTGKTTLLRIIAGDEVSDDGNVVMENGVQMRYLPQEPAFNENDAVLDAVLANTRVHKEVITQYENAIRSNDENAINNAIASMDAANAWDLETRLRQLLGNLDLHDLHRKVGTLSGGERKRLSIAAAFIDEPQFVLLDEPTNHLDLKSIEWLEQYLSKSKITMLMVTHDRYFLDRICNTIIEMDQGQIFQYQGNYSYFVAKRAERHEMQEMQTEKAQSKLKQELEWANRMPKARTTKAKFRLDGVENLKDAARKTTEDALDIQAVSQRLGKKVINVHHISKSFDNKPLLTDFSYQFLKGEKVGIVVENGAGKSTLLNIVAGRLEPDSGEVEIGETVKLSYYEQRGIEFDESLKVIEVARNVAEVVEMGNGQTLPVERFLNRFLFPNEMHYQKVAKLSGGEKRRLYLATVLMVKPNFLIFDEPTNDLDIMTLEVLEDYLAAFQGTVIIVSHDRYFMDRIVDHIFEFQGNGAVKDFPGNYTQLRSAQQERVKEQRANSERNAPPKTRTRAKTKLSYAEQKELETIEQELDALSQEKQQVEAQLAAPDKASDELVKLSERFEQINNELEIKEMRWLELSELKDQLASKTGSGN
jgi:ATP-binding cassette subfamily F protein uup